MVLVLLLQKSRTTNPAKAYMIYEFIVRKTERAFESLMHALYETNNYMVLRFIWRPSIANILGHQLGPHSNGNPNDFNNYVVIPDPKPLSWNKVGFLFLRGGMAGLFAILIGFLIKWIWTWTGTDFFKRI